MKRIVLVLVAVLSGPFFQITVSSALMYQPMSLAKAVDVPPEMQLPDQSELQAVSLRRVGPKEDAVSEYASRKYQYYLDVNPHFLPVTYCIEHLRLGEKNEINPYLEVISGFDGSLYLACLIVVDETGLTELARTKDGVTLINHIGNSPDFRVTKFPK